MNSRRSVRQYSDKPVSGTLLDELLRTSARGSTMGNMQLYSVVSTTSAEGKKALSPAHFDQPMVTGAPLVLTFCVDFRRFSTWCEMRRAEPGYDNLLSFQNAAIDTMILAERFATAAEEAGLGICYLGTTLYNAGQIIDLLHLPRLVFPLTTLTVGYPAGLPEQSDRLEVEAFLHEEYYRDYTAQDIDRIYAFKESLPGSRHFIEENGKETLAQVFTDVRYTKAGNEAMSEALWQALRRQGFVK